MTLRFDLGPFESLFIGRSVLTNHGDRTTFVLEGEIPILRAKDVLSPQLAATSLERLYCCVQQMYLEEDVEKYRGPYLALAVKALSENSNLHVDLQTADQMVKSGQFYRALKCLKKLIGANSSSVQMATARK
jgi:flagellar biosynthesis repressor protein FlbT